MRLLSFLLALFCVPALGADNMKAFPPADDGMTRHVIHLPKLDDESLAKVQLIVGKKVMVDTVNRHFLIGKIEARNIEGWGFTRYVVPKVGPLAGTLMAPRPGTPMGERFVPLGGQPYLIRYNSKLPVVVYVPEGAEVQYRIWKADARATPAREG